MNLFTPEFLVSLQGIVHNLSEKDYFAEIAGNECDEWPMGVDLGRLEKITSEYTGRNNWLFSEKSGDYNDRDIVLLIEALFGLVSEPVATSGVYHQFCNRTHFSEFDRRNGRYEYTKRVNVSLKRFARGAQIVKGKVVYTGTIVPSLAQSVRDSFRFNDNELDRLVGAALEQYSSSDENSRIASLSSLAQAIERAKTLLNVNKKRGASELVSRLERDQVLASPLENYLRDVKRVNDNHGIRHAEMGQEITFPGRADLVDFWFASQYALLQYLSRAFAESRPMRRGR